MFRSTPPREGRRVLPCSTIATYLFRSTPPREGRPDFVDAEVIKTFRSTPPREGRPGQLAVVQRPVRFRSTPPREGRPDTGNASRNSYVSIHAPTRGATERGLHFRCLQLVSIHAPTRGATRYEAGVRGPHGVSIHAPTRGATSHKVPYSYYDLFRSTPPREGRQGPNMHYGYIAGFDPRPHARGD